MDKLIFISYKREERTAAIARKLDQKIRVNLKAFGFETWFDRRSIDVGQAWSPEIDRALDAATHFLALLSDDYWDSSQCQRELEGAVQRFESARERPRLLLVQTQFMDLTALEVSRGQQSATVNLRGGQIKTLGDVNFLGPYDQAGRLGRLAEVGSQALDDQLFTLVQGIKTVP